MSTRRRAFELPARPNGSLCAGMVGVILLSATTSFAGRIPEEWDALPQVDSISFTKTSVGLGGHIVFDRATSRIEEVSNEKFEQDFAGSIGFDAAEVIDEGGIGSTVLLKTSSGKHFTTTDAACSEGMDTEHSLSLDGHPVKDHVAPCYSISCVEIVGDHLWLGTRYDGEYGEYPADGIVVQTLDGGRLVETLNTKRGLTGDLIRAIRLDPFDKKVWIATNEGINVVDQNFRVAKTFFFYLELDAETATPKVGFSPAKRKSDPLAMKFVGLQVSDPKGLHAAVSSIPVAVQEQFISESNECQYCPENEVGIDTAFAPKEMNALVPFYIEAARSSNAQARSSALRQMCAFNDPRVVDFLTKSDLPVAPGQAHDPVRECLDKFMRFDLLSAQQKNEFGLRSARQKNERITFLIKQESDALGRIHAAASSDVARAEFPVVVAAAKGAKQEGDGRGIELLNDYFRVADGKGVSFDGKLNADGGNFDEQLYQRIAVELAGENGMAPAILEGLEKFRRTMTIRSGCWFFDMRQRLPRRFDAKYAEAILIAIERGSHLRQPPTSDTCAEAFKSQLGDPDVRRAFFQDVYPRLMPEQKALADKLASDPPKKVCPGACEEWCTCDG